MKIEKIHLRFFRNYKDTTLELSNGVNLIVGDNAQGKTNILESIYFLSTSKSHRNVEDVDLIMNDREFADVEAIVKYDGGYRKLSALIHKKGKTLCIQNNPVKKVSEFIGKLNAVMFSPNDMFLFDSSPKYRRRFLDMEIGKMSGNYITELNEYNKLLQDRNALLKMNPVDSILLESITEQMISPQIHIIKKRNFFLEQINRSIQEYYRQISDSNDTLRIEYLSMIPYDSSDEKMKESLKKKYQDSLERDIVLKQSGIGIQREDIQFYLNEKKINLESSQGQRRMVLISMKFALVKLIYEYTGEYPVLLLDDVLSELGEKKRNNLLRMIPQNIQTLITATEASQVNSNILRGTRIFIVKEGVCQPWQKM